MGKSFAVQVESGKAGKDGRPAVGPVYRSEQAKDGFPVMDDSMNTSWEVFRAAAEKYPGNRMLGWREITNGKAGHYLWKTYKEIYHEVLQVGSALRQLGAEPGSRIGIYGVNCPQWIVVMEACNGYSLLCVPLYDTLGSGAVDYIIEHAEIDIVFVQDKKAKEILSSECRSTQRLKSMVSFTSMTIEQKAAAENFGIKAYSWNEFLLMNSWTKRPVEVESLPLLSPSDQPADQHDSPCAQITPPETKAICKGWLPMTDNSEYKEHKDISDVYMGKDLEIGVPMNPGPQHESYPTEKVSTKLTSESVERLPESDSNNKDMLGLESSNLSDKSGTQATDLIGLIANSTIAQETIRVTEAPGGLSNDSEEKEMATDGSTELPSLILSLKRLRSTEKGGRNFLKRSDLSAFSAFSRYPTSVPSTQAPTLNGGSCSPTDKKTSEALKTVSTDTVIYDVNAALLTGSNGSSDNNDMGS